MSKEDKKDYRTYFGKIFTKRKDGYWNLKYWHKESKSYKTILAHRHVWENYNGLICGKYDVHHKDGDKDNNEISNLELLSRSDHLKEHWLDEPDKRRGQLDSVRPLKWLKSEEGKKAVSEKGKQVWKERKPKLIKCEHCGTEKEFKRWARFCTKSCYMKWRHRQGLCK